ncbi:MAG: hypothetical protein GQ569_08455 [Methylococcaceae bacterium]|nr:hypothetical protein [Methylococcaceae bacterium]
MNKYEKLFQSIFDKTKNKDIKWKQINKTAHSDLIFNPNLVFRQFSGSFQKGKGIFEVIFIEKKMDDPEHHFTYQKYSPELLVIDEDNELLVTLTDSIIDKNQMIELMSLLENKNERARVLFE